VLANALKEPLFAFSFWSSLSHSGGLANIKLFSEVTYSPTSSHSVRLPAALHDAKVWLAVAWPDQLRIPEC
jgi:hypothetical protein